MKTLHRLKKVIILGLLISSFSMQSWGQSLSDYRDIAVFSISYVGRDVNTGSCENILTLEPTEETIPDIILCSHFSLSTNLEDRQRVTEIRITGKLSKNQASFLVESFTPLSGSESFGPQTMAETGDLGIGALARAYELGIAKRVVSSIVSVGSGPSSDDSDLKVKYTLSDTSLFNRFYKNLKLEKQELFVNTRDDKFDKNYMIAGVKKIGYDYTLEYLNLFYIDPYDKIAELTISGNDVYLSLQKTEVGRSIWTDLFNKPNPSIIRVVPLPRDRIELVGPTSEEVSDIPDFESFRQPHTPKLSLGLYGILVDTELFNQKFSFSLKNGDLDYNQPFVWAGGIGYNISWYPSKKFPLLNNLKEVGFSFKKYDDFTYKITQSTIDFWDKNFLNGDVFKINQQDDLPKNLLVNQYRLSAVTNDIIQISGLNTNMNDALTLMVDYQLPYKLKSKPSAVNKKVEVMNGFDEVADGFYTFTKNRLTVGFQYHFDPSIFTITKSSNGHLYLKDIGLRYSKFEQHIDQTFIKDHILHFTKATPYTAFLPEASIAFKKKSSSEDLFYFNVRGNFGDMVNSVMYSNAFKLKKSRITWHTHLTVFDSFAYNAVFVTGPQFRFDLSRKK